ncbi:MAG: sulfatase, partial [Clostridiaceae bacterium]|nr:sulfatase [Clostridiaceae bacterium]
YKYIRRIYEEDEFYDLTRDPQERKNRIHEKEYREAILEMKELLLDWYQKSCDVVPFEKDDRHSREMIRQAVKNICPPEYKAEVEQMIENREGTLFEIRRYCEQAAERVKKKES